MFSADLAYQLEVGILIITFQDKTKNINAIHSKSERISFEKFVTIVDRRLCGTIYKAFTAPLK